MSLRETIIVDHPSPNDNYTTHAPFLGEIGTHSVHKNGGHGEVAAPIPATSCIEVQSEMSQMM